MIPKAILLAGVLATAFVGAPAQGDPCRAALPALGTPFSGTVRYVGDGDGFCVGNSSDPRTWIEVRIADFFAPELHAPGGEDAKIALKRLALGRSVDCIAGRRSYDRTIARCIVGGRDIGDSLRAIGGHEGGRGWLNRRR